MRLTEEARIFWKQLTGWQQVKICLAAGLVLVLMLSGWVDSCRSMREVRRHEREAAKAKREADDALRRAAKIAEALAARQAELERLEDLRNEAETKLDSASRDARDARDAYDWYRSNPRTDIPDADTLCRELAELGYPCG